MWWEILEKCPPETRERPCGDLADALAIYGVCETGYLVIGAECKRGVEMSLDGARKVRALPNLSQLLGLPP